jgi:DUF2934 family protein
MKEKGRKRSAPAEAATGPPTHDEIAQRAFEIYLARGGGPGKEDEDWQQAERELREAREKA